VVSVHFPWPRCVCRLTPWVCAVKEWRGVMGKKWKREADLPVMVNHYTRIGFSSLDSSTPPPPQHTKKLVLASLASPGTVPPLRFIPVSPRPFLTCSNRGLMSAWRSKWCEEYYPIGLICCSDSRLVLQSIAEVIYSGVKLLLWCDVFTGCYIVLHLLSHVQKYKGSKYFILGQLGTISLSLVVQLGCK
jgi:hypothetical protein